MKICAIICEYNPFHNGHKYLIGQAKTLSGCDAVLCLMSGSFTQRGEPTILPKFLRAEHAVKGGADCVIQLPAAFSVAPAEIFARGAVSILSEIPSVTHLAFGSENASVDDIEKACSVAESAWSDDAKSKKFSALLANFMSDGNSYKKSLSLTLSELGADETLITSPNGILALEYAKAIKDARSDIKILPVLRAGAGYADSELKENFSSASAIRANIKDGKIAQNVPACVAQALKDIDLSGVKDRSDALIRYSLSIASKENLAKIFGCTEGLENKLKSSADLSAEEIIASATNKRYTASRIKRILAANMLGLCADDAKRYIREGTYIKPLAVRKSIKGEMFAELAKSSLPVIIKKMSLNSLKNKDCAENPSAAEKCYESDRRADFVRSLIFGEKAEYEFTVKTIT